MMNLLNTKSKLSYLLFLEIVNAVHVFLVPVKMTMSLILTLLPYRNPVRLSGEY